MTLSTEQLSKAYSLKLEGYSWWYIVDKVKASSTRSLRDQLDKAGYDMANIPRNVAGKRQPALSEEQKLKAKQLKVEGKSIEDIASMLGVTVGQLKYYKLNHINRSSLDKIHHIIDVNFFDKVDNELKAYYLGLIAADGSISKRSGLKIELQAQDSYILEPLRNNISPTKPIYKYNRGNKGITYSLELGGKEFVSKLAVWNILPRKSMTNTSLPNLPKEYMPHFIRGYFDGNGSVYLSKEDRSLRLKFIGNSLFIHELKHYLDLTNNIFTTDNNFTSYFSVAKKVEVERLFNYMYRDATYYLKRKYRKFLEYYLN